MSANKLTYLLHLRGFISFLRIIQGIDYSRKYISQPTRLIGSLLYYRKTKGGGPLLGAKKPNYVRNLVYFSAVCLLNYSFILVWRELGKIYRPML
jgi:hypothetical protein